MELEKWQEESKSNVNINRNNKVLVKSETDSFRTDSSFDESQYSDEESHDESQSRDGYHNDLEEVKEPNRNGGSFNNQSNQINQQNT